MLEELESELASDLDDLEAIGRLRTCPAIAGKSRLRGTLDGKPVVSFCSNDYLGLAEHPDLARAAQAAIANSGFGAGASRLVSGDLPEHRALEVALARFLWAPAALLFPTGYQTNLGVITALAGPQDLVVSDAANHASIIDACRLSRATVAVYAHRDASGAAGALHQGHRFRRRFIVTESLFSMDGDIAPLRQLAETARHARAALVVDEAHAIGGLGPGGRGLCAAVGIVPDVLVGTLGKAFGSYGGFAVGTLALRSTLVNRARSFLFTTAPPPALAAAAHAALQIIQGPEGDALRDRLAGNIQRLRAKLSSSGAPVSPIIPLVLGSEKAAVFKSNILKSHGIFVQAIRPPTVPEGTDRLRITVSAGHRDDEIDALSLALG